jgi:GNAT superfamily N-acetyltransferase
MRRIPGLVPVRADRPAAETAAEIVERLHAEPLLRRARAGDAESAFQVQRAASLAALAHIYPPERYPFPDEAIRERWKEAISDTNGDVIVAHRADRVVGVAAAKQGWLDGLYVVPEEWGTGVAGLLHDEAMRSLAQAGATDARLWVLEGNARARRFYERRGWRLDGSERVVPFPPHPLDVGYTKEL